MPPAAHPARMHVDELAAAPCGDHKNRAAVILSFTCETVPAMRKRGNPYFSRLIKRAHVNGVIGWWYAAAVNRQRDRERLATVPPLTDVTPRPESSRGALSPLPTHHFRAMPRTWGNRIPGTPLVAYKQHLYLEVKVQVRPRAAYFLLNGTEVTPSNVAPWLLKRRPSRQQLQKEVILRDYRLDHITAMIWAGQTIPIERVRSEE